MSLKKAISIFATIALCSICCAQKCSAMKEDYKINYMGLKCEGENCNPENDKDKKDVKDDEAKKAALDNDDDKED